MSQLLFVGLSGTALLFSIFAIPIVSIAKLLGLIKVHELHANLTGKIAIVSGANTGISNIGCAHRPCSEIKVVGIGKSTAQLLASKGATVIIACRSLEKGNSAAKDISLKLSLADSCKRDSSTSSQVGSVVAMELDLSDLRSVRSFVASFSKVYGKLDILVNNAGMNSIQELGSPKRTAQGTEIVFGTNFVGPFALTLLLLDLLKASGDGRIVNLSSVMHRFASRDVTRAASGADESRGYEDSKLAMILFTRELRRRLAGTRVVATAVNPGFVASDIWRVLYGLPAVGVIWRALCAGFALTVDQGAAVSAAAAAAALPAAEEESLYLQPYLLPLGMGLPFEIMGAFAGPRQAQPALPKDEPEQSRALWRLCEGLLAN